MATSGLHLDTSPWRKRCRWAWSTLGSPIARPRWPRDSTLCRLLKSGPISWYRRSCAPIFEWRGSSTLSKAALFGESWRAWGDIRSRNRGISSRSSKPNELSRSARAAGGGAIFIAAHGERGNRGAPGQRVGNGSRDVCRIAGEAVRKEARTGISKRQWIHLSGRGERIRSDRQSDQGWHQDPGRIRQRRSEGG